MLIKLNISNITITNTYADTNGTNESTTAKIDSITFENEVKPEEVKELINGVASMVKDVITTSKKNTNTSKQDKRYNITKYNIDGSWECQKYHQYIIIQDRKNNNNKITFLFENGDSLTRKLDEVHYKMYNKQKYITSQYDCNVIEL